MAIKIPIPVFSKNELDVAHQCAVALWYGVDFKTGRNRKRSDAELLETFATPFFNIPRNNSYTATPGDISRLIAACKLNALFRLLKIMDFNAGLLSVDQKIYPIYQNYLQRTPNDKVEMFGAACIQALSDGITTTANGRRLVLASRMLFFVVPTMPIFNMNNRVAKEFGLGSLAYLYKDDYCKLMLDGMNNNNLLLSTYSLPIDLNGMNTETYSIVYKSDWWQRRILDIAILINLGLAAPKSGLNGIINAKVIELQNSILI